MTKGDKSIPAQACPHCGNSIAYLKPVGERTLQAARALMQAGKETSKDVAAALEISMPYAAILLGRAQKAGIVDRVLRQKLSKLGGAYYVYAPTMRLKAYAPDEYRAWRAGKRARHNSAA